ncbi:bifunctional riboflavin kinase/FMN adenylyltransferase [Moraxella haemolytica]|uniref:bifunctional riboflavin kinase/FMN adenylyltransferase n=1 Tax=Moraxella haemolytica TaxID=2904119 RepID=UPI0025427D74|nr:bifunctional riboflavin kinase/FMN adenylyltransferase [Moraxella sp. ZY171148]WII94796.1 bifunctional riboflavin kinase/FMN adenylyltransferase [Moraxella sp. ZY171148]
MQIISLDLSSPAVLPPIALTIGNYDGVHLGHRSMIRLLLQTARQNNLASAIMVFEPQPREFFCADNPPPRLSSLAEKALMMSQLGVDYLIVARFDDKFRSLSARCFANLLTALNAQCLVLGDDFRFGHDRAGDADFLRGLGFGVDSLPTVMTGDKRISSTAVRMALAKQDLPFAKELLGRDYAITGQVVHGDKIGRTLNFATANIALNRPKPALLGVYGADVFVMKGGKKADWGEFGLSGGVAGVHEGSLFGAVNVGMRPTINGKEYRLEVHLPKFAGDLYGLTLQVVFLTYLHGEKKYGSLELLKAGIADDVSALLAWRDAVA